MVDQQRRRVEQEMTKLVDEIDRNYLRKMQVKLPKTLNLRLPKTCFS